MISKFSLLLLSLFMFFATHAKSTTNYNSNSNKSNLYKKIEIIYKSMKTNNFALPEINCFKKAMDGFYNLKEKGLISKDILTVIDFSLSSTKNRLWVIDLSTNTILYNTLVSHGMKSGLEYANSFSNSQRSNKSSLGFYATGETYNGKHGLSLKLDGLEKGINSNARARAVVVHGAGYANSSFIKSQGYLGRSQGCPAIPEGLKAEIIQIIKNKSCLFIYHPTRTYLTTSKIMS